MKITNKLIPLLILAWIIPGFLNLGTYIHAETIEKIVAAVNGELITYSDIKNAENERTQILSQQFQGEELQKKLDEMKKALLNTLIDQKVLLSFAREKNYNVDSDFEMIVKNIKKQYNFNSDEELKQAIAAQGIEYERWKEFTKDEQMIHRYIYEMIGSKINIDNAAIMEYYKKNIKQYTVPMKFKLNCILLNKSGTTPEAIEEKKNTILNELKTTPFADVAKKYTELPSGDILLGEFKEGELNKNLEKAALELSLNGFSGWVETDTSWYILQLIERSESQLIEYQKVRNDIEERLREEEQAKKIDGFIQELKKDSHIKIYE